MAVPEPWSSDARPEPVGPVGRITGLVRRWPPIVQDGALAAIVMALHVLALATFDPDEMDVATDGRAVDAGAYLLIVVSSVPLLWRRRAPIVALAASAAGLLAFASLQYVAPFVGYAQLAALYSVVVYRGNRHGLVAAALTFVVVLLAYAVSPFEFEPAQIGFDLLIVATAVALGDGTRNRLAANRAHEARMAELAAEQARRARQAVSDERARIARELHDLVAHSMSVVAVQAGVGNHLIERDPAKAKQALATIEETSRQALTEMRRLLGVLRTAQDDAEPELNPQPGLDDLDDLLRHAAAAGVHVEVVREGTVQPLPSGVELSAYRILQEALTNTVKHAGPARAVVTLRYEREALVIEVADDGRGLGAAATGRAGYGLVGMRERAAVVGGEVHAGPRPGGGFRVSARLPYREDRP